MKKKTWKLLFITVLVIFLFSSGFLVKTIYGYRKAEGEYDKIAYEAVKVIPGVLDEALADSGGSGQNAGSVDAGVNAQQGNESDGGVSAQAVDLNRMLSIDFDYLKKKNPDIIAWLDIPGTGISYPVAKTGDNDFYISHGINGQKSSSGAVFMDYRNKADLTDSNTILFGHNMRNGSMFAGLRQFKSQSYRNSRPYVDLYFPDGRVRFEIYSCYEESASGENFPTLFTGKDDRNAFLSTAASRSLYKTDVAPEKSGHTLMLATCTGKGYSHRLVVHAAQIEEHAEQTEDSAVQAEDSAVQAEEHALQAEEHDE